MKYVIRFSKRGNIAFISHLDLTRVFLRALRASGLRPAYSKGFNPHPKFSIVLPLSLGFESSCELLEFETDAIFNFDEAVKLINDNLPNGLRILEIRNSEENSSKSLASQVKWTEYSITTPHYDNIDTDTSDWLSQNKIIITKVSRKTGKKTEIDIKPMIRSFKLNRDLNNLTVYNCIVSASSSAILNPLVLMNKWYANFETEYDPADLNILRTNIYLE